MTALQNLVAEVAILVASGAVQEAEKRLADTATSFGIETDLTKQLVLGDVSEETRAVYVLSQQRFYEATAALQCAPLATLEEQAVATRIYQTLQNEMRILEALFRVLVEREVPEAAKYNAWQLHHSGQVYVALQSVSKDKKFVDYFSGHTPEGVIDL